MAKAREPAYELDRFEKEVERQRKRLAGRPGIRPKTVAISIGCAAILSLIGGMAFASVLTDLPVSQEASNYSASSAASPSFPNAPTLSLTTVPSGVSGCTSGPVSYPAGSATNYVAQVELAVGVSSCTGNDWAESWVWDSPATLPVTETVHVMISVELGATWYQADTIIGVTAGTPGGTPVLAIYLDLGTTIPAITSMSAVVT
jgi:hypothetical protein